MRTIAVKSSVLIISIFSQSQLLFAQLDLTKFEVGIHAGTFIYEGDLAPSAMGSYKTMKPVIGIHINRIFSPSFALRANIDIGKIKGDDSKFSNPGYRQQRNFNFTTPVFEFSGLLVWSPLKTNGEEIIRKFSPYVFAGAGFSFLKINRDWSNFNTEYFAGETNVTAGLEIDAQHRLPRLTPVLPVGLGISYSLTPRISLNAETSYRLMSTDYLDGFSEAANPSKKDHYHSHTIGLTYHFGRRGKLDCPANPN